mmetsp:Transcript_70614/g.165586  ORF Transcript_70614/g.165586 Transcript_70614/m.165586 type:complete len:582 (-) Transcript_70614:9-1754(-)
MQEDVEDVGNVEAPWAFISVTVLLEVVLAGSLMLQAFRGSSSGLAFCDLPRRVCRSLRHLARLICPLPSASRNGLCRQVRLLRQQIGRQLVRIYLSFLLIVVLLIQVRVVFSFPATITSQLAWTIAALLSWMVMAAVLPQVLFYDFWYVGYSLLLLAFLLPGSSGTDSAASISMMLFGIFRLPFIVVAGRVYLVPLCSLLFLGVMTWWVVDQQIDMGFGGGSAVLIAEYLQALVLTALAVAVEDYLLRRAEQDVDRTNALTQLNAASSLLQLTCDAVVELDADLRLTKHSRQLAAMLLRDRPGESLAGKLLTDFMPVFDAQQANSKLRNFRSSQQEKDEKSEIETMHAHAFHTRLVDSCYTKLRTEVLQVMYTTGDGAICHLVGLRDFTDTKPYARDMNDLDLSASFDGFCSPTGSMTSMYSSVEEKSPPLSSSFVPGMLFLDVDVEGLRINGASARLSDLVGGPVSQVFRTPHTLQLFERLQVQGRLLAERGEIPPSTSQYFTFDEMPAHLGTSRDDDGQVISGSMHVFQVQSGLNILLAFQVGSRDMMARRSSRRSRRSSRRRNARSPIFPEGAVKHSL